MLGFPSSRCAVTWVCYTRWTSCIPDHTWFRRCRFAITAAFTRCFTGKVGWIRPHVQGVILDYGWDRSCLNGNDVQYQPDPEQRLYSLYVFVRADFCIMKHGANNYNMMNFTCHASEDAARSNSVLQSKKQWKEIGQCSTKQTTCPTLTCCFFSLLTSYIYEEIRGETCQKICLVSNSQPPPTFGSFSMWIKTIVNRLSLVLYGKLPVTFCPRS